MSKKYRSIVLFFILLLPYVILGNTQDSTYYRNRIRELFSSGRELSREGRDIEALDTFKLFLNYRIKLYGNEHPNLGSPYLAMGVCYKNLGQHKLAIETFNLAEKNYLLRNDPNSTSIASLYINIGNVYRAKLNYKNALNYFERALTIYSNQIPADPIKLTDAFYSIAEIHYLMGNYSIAEQILRDNIDKCDEYNQIYFNELLALSFQDLKNHDKALMHYKRTLSLARTYYDKTDVSLAIVYMNYAEYLFSVNQLSESYKNLEIAHKIISETQPFRGEQLSRYFELLGNLKWDQPIKTLQINSFKTQKKRNINEAIKWYTKGLNALSKTNRDLDIHSVKIENCLSFLDCLALIQQIGDAHYELALIDKEEKTTFYTHSLIKALEYYAASSQLTQQARREISSDESKIQLAELEHSTFTKTIETAYLAYNATHQPAYLQLAFNNSEQLKSSSVFDKLSDDLAQENSLIPDSLLQQEKKLNSTISIYNQKIFEESSYDDADSSLIESYNTIIFDASRERDELNRLFEEEYSDYYNLKYSSNMLSIHEIQNQMDKDEAILEYVIIDPQEDETRAESDSPSLLYTFLITKNNSKFQKTSINKTLKESLESVFAFMSNSTYIFTKNDDSKQFCIASNKLYHLLIAPFENDLINKNIVIIPDGQLNYIAFDGLLRNMPDTSKMINFSKLDYLIKDFNINYANSVNILFQNRGNKQKLNNRTLAFAPEYNSEQFEMSNASYTLMPLPGVQKEVDAIAKTIKTTIFRGEEATEQNFRENCKTYDILHLAMHAYINDSLPSFSRLAFAPQTNEQAISSDGWLNTTDIYNLELNARLAVLSACNTGVGKLQKGEGMMSLARGFLYAGCPSIIMSLWEVEDESGTQIMSSFYKNLRKGHCKDEALRQAKLSYLKNSNSRLAHPHYWMSFKSIGDNSPIYTSYDVYFFALLIFLILAFTIDQTIRIRKVRQKRRDI